MSTDNDYWIKVYRKIVDSQVFQDAELLRLWIWALCRANHTDRFFAINAGGGMVTVFCQRGQFITGRKKGSEIFGCSESTFERRLKKLEALEMVTLLPERTHTLVTIRNYSQYQRAEQPVGQQIATPNATFQGEGEQPLNNLRTTSEQPAGTNKNDKKDKKREAPPVLAPKNRTKFVVPALEEIQAYCRERSNNVNAEQFLDHYTANGWIQGKGKPIRDWRAAVRTWERNGFSKGQQPTDTDTRQYRRA